MAKLIARAWPAAAVAVAGVVLSWIVHDVVERDESARVHRVLERTVDWRANDLQHKLLQAADIVIDAAAFIGAARDPTPASFRAFLERRLAADEAVRAVLWAPLVKDADRAAFETAASRVGKAPA